ncbi:DUF1801 domain-containing protein [Wenxinia saemankumensis]|uniref:YdhG-like domain-containing protein n=1 Tax=Wenxinia saemankumensis TaxID=1447782 RepID=A0A1M6E262_9RHOB|nr:DUF1801 domain-containing protein [Wenxinia saemankumensis]SHI79576.1 protein of unknown function (DU1801) [Wenxinia saemankumensis]
MAENSTRPTGVPVEEYIAGVEPEGRRVDAIRLDAIFRQVTGWAPAMWGPSMIGYGAYDYRYESGRSGTFLATGFAPRRANMVVYILPGYAEFGTILSRVGPHRTGKSCLYLGRLDRVDTDVLAELIAAGLADLGRRWPVRAAP